MQVSPFSFIGSVPLKLYKSSEPLSNQVTVPWMLGRCFSSFFAGDGREREGEARAAGTGFFYYASLSGFWKYTIRPLRPLHRSEDRRHQKEQSPGHSSRSRLPRRRWLFIFHAQVVR
jgi:hypothetical protein